MLRPLAEAICNHRVGITSVSGTAYYNKIRATFRQHVFYLSPVHCSISAYSYAAADLQDRLRGDAIQLAEGRDCRTVVDGDTAEGIT